MYNERTLNLRLPHIGGVRRITLWITLIALSAVILSFPVYLSPMVSNNIESVAIFANLPLFTVLFVIWMLLLLLLIFSRGVDENIAVWEKLVLVIVFAAVFLGFWTIVTPLGRGDVVSNLGHVRLLQESIRNISITNPIMTGFDFPGIYFVISTIARFTGIGLFGVSTILLFISNLLLVLLLYILFIKTLRNVYIASLGVMLAIMGNIIISGLYSFQCILAIPFLVTILILLNRDKPAGKVLSIDFIMILIIFVALVGTHFVTTMAIIFILIGNWVINWLRGEKKNANFTIFNPLMIILMFVFAVWYELYWAHRTFAMLGSFVPGVIQDVKTGELFLTLSLLFSANFSQAVPLWASFVRMFWLVAIYIFGALLTLGKLIWHRSLQVIEIKEIGSILGIGVMASVAMLLAPQGNQFHRFIMYGSIVITPLILRFVFGYLGKWSTTVLVFFAAICLLLVFPTFLVYNGSIVTTAFYPQEAATGEFLEMAFDKGNNIATFSTSIESGPKLSYYYTPDTIIQAPPLYTTSKDESGLWRELDGLTNKFIDWENEKDYGLASYRDYAIFISSEWMKLPFKHLFGIRTDDTRWIKMEEQLVTNTLRVYDNGNIRVYVAP